jgi:hypothetical protein
MSSSLKLPFLVLSFSVSPLSLLSNVVLRSDSSQREAVTATARDVNVVSATTGTLYSNHYGGYGYN